MDIEIEIDFRNRVCLSGYLLDWSLDQYSLTFEIGFVDLTDNKWLSFRMIEIEFGNREIEFE